MRTAFLFASIIVVILGGGFAVVIFVVIVSVHLITLSFQIFLTVLWNHLMAVEKSYLHATNIIDKLFLEVKRVIFI